MPDGGPPPKPADGRNPEHAALLSRVDIFARLDNVALAQLSSHLEPLHVGPGEYVFRQGDEADGFYIAVSGSFGGFVTPSDGRAETRVNDIGPGEYFGETELLTGEPRSTSVRGDGDGELLRLPRGRFLALLQRQPAASGAMLAGLSRRLSSASRAVAENESAAARAIDHALQELPEERRRRVVAAAVLDSPSPAALHALFGEEAADVAADLGRLGVEGGRASTADMRTLRAKLGQELGLEAAREQEAGAAELLVAAGCWEEALSALARRGQRQRFVRALGQALRAIPPLESGRAARWLERISNEEAAADVELAIARASLLEEQGRLDEASQLLMRSMGNAMMGDPTAGSRLMEALGRLSSVGSRSAAAMAHSMVAGKSAPSRPRGRLTPLATGAAALLAGAGAFTAGANPQLSLVLLLASAIVLWAVDLVPSFVVALGLLASFILLRIAAPAQALAGFGTTDWLFVVAVFGIAEAVTRSGLLFRVGLMLVCRLPRGLFWQSGALMLTGVILSPLLPFSTVRGTLTAPLALAVAEASRLEDRSPASAVLGMAAYIGAVPLGFLFLNGSAQSLLLWSLLPEASQRRFDLVGWLLASLPAGIFIGVSMLAVLFLLYRPEQSGARQAGDVSLQLAILGPLSRREVSMIAVLLATLAGWMLAPSLGLDLGTVAIVGLVGAVASGNFSRQAIKGLDWNFLIFYGAILCVARLASSLGLDKAVAGHVSGLVLGLGAGPALFLLAVAVATLLSKLVLMANQAAPLLGLALIPVAPALGVEPWLVAITILMVLFVWVPASQNPMYLASFSACEGRLYSDGQAARANLPYFLVALAGLAVSLPFWHMMGLI